MDTVINSLTEFKTKLISELDNIIFFFEIHYKNLQNEILKNKEIQEKITNKLEELNQYKNVSLIKSLDKQLKESKQQNKLLTKQLNSLKKRHSKQNITVNIQHKNNSINEELIQENKNDNNNSIKEIDNSPDNSNESNDLDESDESDELEVYEKKIKGIIYYMDNQKNVYQKLEDDEIGPLIGIYKKKKLQLL